MLISHKCEFGKGREFLHKLISVATAVGICRLIQCHFTYTIDDSHFSMEHLCDKFAMEKINLKIITITCPRTMPPNITAKFVKEELS